MANVGIVLISHSVQIASGVKELIQQVIQEVPIELAAGTEDGRIGTTIEKISSAIDAANKGDGVLLFYDLGSAKMNAEVVLEMLTDDQIVIAEAPIVEGSYIAAVEASMGKTMEEILETLWTGFPANDNNMK